jgi:hypothetical protein
MALTANLLRTALASLLLLGAGAACKKNNVKKEKQGPDPDSNSGPDSKRGGAKVLQARRDVNESYRLIFTDTDSVSWPKLLRTKWKRFELATPGAQNILDCQLNIDTTGMDLNIDIFNSIGTQIGFSPGPAPNKVKKLAVPIEELGTYFVRVQAAQGKDESDFTVFCAWDERINEPEVVPEKPDKPDKPRRPRHSTPKPEKPADTLEERLARGVEGRILQAYNEGGVMKLNLDKGSAARITVGTEGQILVGKSGLEPLNGGSFRVVRVIDETRCVAESNIRSVGRNNRVVFFK